MSKPGCARCEMRENEIIRRTVKSAPRLTVEQKVKLRGLFGVEEEVEPRPLAVTDTPAITPITLTKVVDTPTFLYWHYDISDVLLYVGVTFDIRIRSKEHLRTAIWREWMATGKLDLFPSREIAEEAELKAINENRPVFNKAGRLYGPESAIEYLVAKGRADLVPVWLKQPA